MGVRTGTAAIALPLAVFALGLGAPAAARAAATPPTLKIEVIGAGQVTGLGITCGQGSLACVASYGTDPTPLTLTATPATGWSFKAWQDDASTCSTAGCALSVTGDMTATVIFATSGVVATQTFAVSTNDSASVSGTVKNGSANDPVDCNAEATPAGTACSLSVLQGSTITVEEIPDPGSLFAGWSGGCTGTGSWCAVYLSGSQSVAASFGSSSSKTLTVTSTGNGTVSGGGISCR